MYILYMYACFPIIAFKIRIDFSFEIEFLLFETEMLLFEIAVFLFEIEAILFEIGREMV